MQGKFDIIGRVHIRDNPLQAQHPHQFQNREQSNLGQEVALKHETEQLVKGNDGQGIDYKHAFKIIYYDAFAILLFFSRIRFNERGIEIHNNI